MGKKSLTSRWRQSSHLASCSQFKNKPGSLDKAKKKLVCTVQFSRDIRILVSVAERQPPWKVATVWLNCEIEWAVPSLNVSRRVLKRTRQILCQSHMIISKKNQWPLKLLRTVSTCLLAEAPARTFCCGTWVTLKLARPSMLWSNSRVSRDTKSWRQQTVFTSARAATAASASAPQRAAGDRPPTTQIFKPEWRMWPRLTFWPPSVLPSVTRTTPCTRSCRPSSGAWTVWCSCWLNWRTVMFLQTSSWTCYRSDVFNSTSKQLQLINISQTFLCFHVVFQMYLKKTIRVQNVLCHRKGEELYRVMVLI